MFESFFASIVEIHIRHFWIVILPAVVLAIASAAYTTRHFAVNTDVNNLLSPNLPWRKHERDYNAAFPQQAASILAVVQGPTPEFAAAAANALTNRLSQQRNLFHSVTELGGGSFFERNRLLYLPTDELSHAVQKLQGAGPLIGLLASDQSLRGLAQALSTSLQGIQARQFTLDDMASRLNMVSDTLEKVLSGQNAAFSWSEVVNGAPAKPEEARHLINIWPVLDYNALQPGRVATAAIRVTEKDVGIESKFMSKVLLTGPVPIADEEFATLNEGADLNGLLSGAIVVIILTLALRFWQIVVAVLVTMGVGLAITAALGLILVHAFSPISVAFAVLFVGVGADFAIQYSVRYREERHATNDLFLALSGAAERVGAPLTLAAVAAAAGFLSFVPTEYRGLAELGLIAGSGMVVAYLSSMTLLPALLRVLKAPPEPKPLGYAVLAPADRFLQRHRVGVVTLTSLIAVVGLPGLFYLTFDFNPMSLRDPNSEPVVALSMLRNDPRIDLVTAGVLTAPNDVPSLSERLSELPQVARVRTLASFISDDQDRKLALIRGASSALLPVLNAPARPAPSDAENVTALQGASKSLQNAARDKAGPGRDAAVRLADDLERLAEQPAAARETAETVFVSPLKLDLAGLRESLQPERVTRSNLPPEIVRDWVAPDGRERVEVIPKGNAENSETLRAFAEAVLSVAPTATGQAIVTYEWGQTIIRAFIEAGALALCSITLLLWMALRRARDVLLTLIPLVVAAAVTLEICGLIGFSLNYANIIALPLLLGIGVAFKIYYVMAWRRGETNFLQSSLTRAVFFSALMTATAFGSLWLSSHPGISSMGKLLALSLVCSLASAALFQPALMSQVRKAEAKAES